MNKPVEFNEKKNWLKLYYHPPILTQLADKYAVRSYVTEKIGAEYLNELYGIYRGVEEIDYEALPNEFIIKATHGCRKSLIVGDKGNLDKEKTNRLLQKWMKYDQYKKVGYEWAYKNIKPGIVIEKLLKEEGKRFLTDYKIVCMNGKGIYAQVVMDLEGKEVQGNFNREFELQKFNNQEQGAVSRQNRETCFL
ncbi:MAG: ATP-grasp fold amidoligase family protein [Flavobacteriaceae bacterium]|nr:ATP-grasp fold amidoligase family protein [Flavobacteriaceae bacterium]